MLLLKVLSVAITGLSELMNLVNLSVELTARNKKTNGKFLAEAESIMTENTPVKTGDTLASEGAEMLPDGFTTYADIEYSLYNDQGFNHYRNGYVKGYHYSDKVVTGLNTQYAEECSKNLSDSIDAILKRTTRAGAGFLNPFTGFMGVSTYRFMFGNVI